MSPGQLPAASSQQERSSQERRERPLHRQRDRQANQNDAGRTPKMQEAGRETGPIYRREENWMPHPHVRAGQASAALRLRACRNAARLKSCAAPP